MRVRVKPKAIWTITIALVAFVTLIFVALGTRLFEGILVERKIVSVGNFHGFEIGSPKEAVLLRAKSLKIISISEIPYHDFEIRKNKLESLNEIMFAQGIVLDNENGARIELQFNKGIVEEVILSVPATGNSWFSKGEGTRDLVQKIPQFLNENPEFVVWPTVRHHGGIHLNTASTNNEEMLYTFDAWTFAGPERFSHFRMYFENGKLKKIEYTRPRIELP